jgi:translocation and assembly module TamB
MLWRRVAIGAGATMALLLLILVGGYVWLDTRSGHAFITRQLAGFTMENGLNIRVGRIEGSIYGGAVLKDVRFRDPKGDFARSPEIRLDWNPFAYLIAASRCCPISISASTG